MNRAQRARKQPSCETDDTDALLRSILPDIQIFAKTVYRNDLAHVLDVDDLVNIGLLGYIQALPTYDPTRRDTSKYYIKLRARGAILDAIREAKWGTRRLRQHAHALGETIMFLSQALGHAPAVHDIAEYMQVSPETVERWRSEIASAQHLWGHRFFDAWQVEKSATRSQELVGEAHIWVQQIRAIIARLPAQECTVMMHYYYDDLSLKEIGKILGVSESRIAQIHSEACERLAPFLHEALELPVSACPVSLRTKKQQQRLVAQQHEAAMLDVTYTGDAL